MTEIADENMFAGFDHAALFGFVFLEGGPEVFTEFLNCCLGKPDPEIAKMLKADHSFQETTADCMESSQENLAAIAVELETMDLIEASRMVFQAAGKARPEAEIRPRDYYGLPE